jgi:hypothetical protein
MLKAAILASAIASATAGVINLENITFEDHVSNHRLTYIQGSGEWKFREKLFNDELKRVRNHNAAGK